jgi:hypothetical protein
VFCTGIISNHSFSNCIRLIIITFFLHRRNGKSIINLRTRVKWGRRGSNPRYGVRANNFDIFFTVELGFVDNHYHILRTITSILGIH